MGQGITYTAKTPDRNGLIRYSHEENAVWQTLCERQHDVLPGRACDPYLAAHQDLGLPRDRVPQCAEISETLRDFTGWSVTPVPAIIPADEFFRLLAARQFPAASFIRDRRELDYLEEPDIFHEVFGHAPHLTDERFAAFTHAYGRVGLNASEHDRILLARLYWFTAEFGLVATDEGPKAYGAGICSSPGETVYAVESNKPDRRAFDVMDVLRTPFRIDTFQPIYYVLENFDILFDLAQQDLTALLNEAKRKGDFAPAFQAA